MMRKSRRRSSTSMTTLGRNPSKPLSLPFSLVLSSLSCPRRYSTVFRQTVGAEDVFLGLGRKTPATASCPHMVVGCCDKIAPPYYIKCVLGRNISSIFGSMAKFYTTIHPIYEALWCLPHTVQMCSTGACGPARSSTQ